MTYDVVITNNNFLISVHEEGKSFHAQMQTIPTCKNFSLLGRRMTSQLTFDCRFCSIYFFKKYGL